MTENEAIARFKSCQENVGKCEKCRFYSCCGIYDMEDTAIKALEEVQQYRKHGVTVESALNNMCDLAAAENLIEEYRAIGTPEECRAAREKQIPKRPIYAGFLRGGYWCLYCNEIVRRSDCYCSNCGQKLDWRNDNE